MKKTAIYGGAFNPVHNGHVKLVHNVINEYNFDRLYIMPSKVPPHKPVYDKISDEDRLNMLKLAFEEIPEALVSDYEIKNTTISYTVNTVKHFKETLRDTKLYLIIGSDMLLSFTLWYQYKEILKDVVIIAAARDNNETEKIKDAADELIKEGGEVNILQALPFVISSSEIREKIKHGDDCYCYLPEKVVQYIEVRELYKE